MSMRKGSVKWALPISHRVHSGLTLVLAYCFLALDPVGLSAAKGAFGITEQAHKGPHTARSAKVKFLSSKTGVLFPDRTEEEKPGPWVLLFL